MRGGANQGERACNREALATKETLRRSGARAGTVDESYLGRSRLTSERKTDRRGDDEPEREVSSGHSSEATSGTVDRSRREGPNGEESDRAMSHGTVRHQMSIVQMELALEPRGEAPTTQCSGEPCPTTQGTDRSRDDDLMGRIVERSNLARALKRVRQNQGSAGTDGMTVGELLPYLREHWAGLREALLTGTYQPSAVRQAQIPKAGGGTRTLGIPTVLDRFIQQAVLQVLQPRFDPTFSESSYGFRPGRSAHDAVCQAQRSVQSGRRWVVDVDLEKFFDRVNHDVLMGRLSQRIADRRVLALIRRYLEAGMMVNGVVQERYEGTPQGGPLSPLLANVLLDEVDKELERRGHCFVRYADDCNVYVRSKRAGERVMEALVGLYAKLRLHVNAAKSAVARVWDRQFLGFSFWVAPGRVVKRRVAPKALTTVKSRLRAITSRSGGRSIAQVVAELRDYLEGWRAYFRLADTPRIFAQLEQWLHRRLRATHLKHWKHGSTVYRELRRRGVSHLVAAMAARFRRNWWRVAAHQALHLALPAAHFWQLGVPRFLAR
jgi:RNA-directed DNA polymerase